MTRIRPSRCAPHGGLALAAVVILAAGCTGRIGRAGDPSGGNPSGGGGPQGGAGGPGGGCVGGGGVGGGGGGAGSPGGASPPGAIQDSAEPAWTRRLSNQEIGNAIEAITGARPAALAQLPSDQQDYSFDRVVQAQTISATHLEAYSAIASEIADALTPDRLGPAIPSCAATQPLGPDGPMLASARRPCIEKLVDRMAPRAFRRPLASEKRAALLKLYDDAGSYADGLRQVVQGIFTGPEFLYLVEIGAPVAGRPGVFALDGREVATRLSLFLCETVPDDTLLAAAATDLLRRPEQIAAQAERLFDDTCAKRTVLRLFRQWLQIDHLDGLTRDAVAFPGFGDQLRNGMAAESDRLVQHVTWDGNGGLADLFSASFSFLDQDVASLYEMKLASPEPRRVELPAHRRGILTHPSVLAATALPSATSPVKRGVYVVRELLCGHLPSPPQDVEIFPPKPDPNATTRERWERHSSDPFCASCHQIIDPVGFAMEDFDAIGRHRTVENGRPINAVGGVPSIGIEVGKVQGAAQLSLAIARTQELADCFAQHLFRFALGRLDGDADGKSLWELRDTIGRGGSLRQALVALTRTFAFRHRATQP